MAFGLAISEHSHSSGHPSLETSLIKLPCIESQDKLQDSDPAELIAKTDNVRKQTKFFCVDLSFLDCVELTLLLFCYLQRRRAQNRASQRAFRERKDNRIKTLEAQLSSLEEEHAKLLHCHHEQRRTLDRMNGHVQELTDEIETLRCSRPADNVGHFAAFDLVPSTQASTATSLQPDVCNDTEEDTTFAKPRT
ncbi:uncharacterized protein TRUGW13939_10221 [Talaromyces rugulosus]|uniref:BZIP domain-containing protein n=1 Tax=Talaromyces rugulosus TaxID=121627 RepID=A0A7H8REU6_TALRU|nr:uncharacterized protein TRUGW13939_10221 [Talaromyces rugulosus]QKX63053.1 hypothetical protein TRUGW13939_10221 [Talaromyces rugulosus]